MGISVKYLWSTFPKMLNFFYKTSVSFSSKYGVSKKKNPQRLSEFPKKTFNPNQISFFIIESLLFYMANKKTKLNLKDAKLLYRRTIYLIYNIKISSKKNFQIIKTMCYSAILKIMSSFRKPDLELNIWNDLHKEKILVDDRLNANIENVNLLEDYHPEKNIKHLLEGNERNKNAIFEKDSPKLKIISANTKKDMFG